MKKILTLFFALLILNGCSNDFLERSSLTQIAETNFWKSESDAYLALNAAYSSLQTRSLYGGSLNGWQGFTGFDCIGDNAYNQYEWEGPGIFMEGTLNPTNGPTQAVWDNSYTGIARVNAIIKNVNEISEDLIPTPNKNALLGQAYFLRALFYFNLAVYFEDVPLILAPQTLQEAFVPKNTYAEVTAQIVEDLKFASESLPVAHPANLYGYATKGAALSLLARVQLYNKVYEGTDGVLNLTEQVLALGYSLHPDYATLFTPTNEKSPEIIFSVRFLRGADTSNGEIFSGTYAGTPKVDVRPMANLANDYYCTDGLPITSSPLYNPNNKKLNRDPRATGTIYFNGDQYLDNPVRVFNSGGSPTGFGQRKYIRRGPDADGNGISADGSQDFYVIRYADVLLMRAEAMAETNDATGAIALVNQVRARVNMPPVSALETNIIQVVRHERRVELALEGLRFMDLKRWGQVEQAVQRATSDAVGPYNPQYLGKRSEVFPIPQVEIDVNTNLVQHPAWQ